LLYKFVDLVQFGCWLLLHFDPENSGQSCALCQDVAKVARTHSRAAGSLPDLARNPEIAAWFECRNPSEALKIKM